MRRGLGLLRPTLSLQRSQGGKWGAVVRDGGGHFKPAGRLSRSAAASAASSSSSSARCAAAASSRLKPMLVLVRRSDEVEPFMLACDCDPCSCTRFCEPPSDDCDCEAARPPATVLDAVPGGGAEGGGGAELRAARAAREAGGARGAGAGPGAAARGRAAREGRQRAPRVLRSTVLMHAQNTEKSTSCPQQTGLCCAWSRKTSTISLITKAPLADKEPLQKHRS